MGQLFTAIIVTDPLGEFPGGEFARRLDNRAFAVQPAGLNGIEPGALGGQAADEKPEAPRAFRVAIGYCQVMEHAFSTLPPDARFVGCCWLYSGFTSHRRQKQRS